MTFAVLELSLQFREPFLASTALKSDKKQYLHRLFSPACIDHEYGRPEAVLDLINSVARKPRSFNIPGRELEAPLLSEMTRQHRIVLTPLIQGCSDKIVIETTDQNKQLWHISFPLLQGTATYCSWHIIHCMINNCT
ncbi:hypothetical protein L596_016973 [Steinernema carpocapsae]|uniref:Uncharacterized protein n=1 Tax=Steinernema carpocapsae TaxID=34508 RepID=A0A4U5N0A5_STECR|nr:hypothetical protein L596_016973 [Steinernema carpocapsae]